MLARHRHRRVKASERDIVRALTGNWREEHLFVLTQALAMYDDIAVHLRECDTRPQALLAERSAATVDLNVELAILFDQLPGVRMSDAANRAVERAKREIFVPDWKKVFERDAITESIHAITRGD